MFKRRVEVATAIAMWIVLALMSHAPCRAETAHTPDCITKSTESQDSSYLYIRFLNKCTVERPVRVCAFYDDVGKDTNVVGDTVPAKKEATLRIVNNGIRQLKKYTWLEGSQNPCPQRGMR